MYYFIIFINMEQRYMKLSEYANVNRIKYRAAWNRFKKGKIEGAFIDKYGKILIPYKNVKKELSNKKCAIYCRVSSNEMKENLNRQAERLKNYAINNGYEIVEIVKEVGSGMNDSRNKLINLFKNDEWTTLIVENKDRLTRFGFNYIKELLALQNKQIVVVNQTDDDKTDLMQDLTSIIYSFSARMYGLRRKKNKEEIIKFLEN